MTRTAWNTKFYDPRLPAAATKRGEVHFKRGEIYAHVYAAILAGVDNVRDLCTCVGRRDQRILDALYVLEEHGYVGRSQTRHGSAHNYTWEALK